MGDGPQELPRSGRSRGRWLGRSTDRHDVPTRRSGHPAGSDRQPETAAETIAAGLSRGSAAGPNILPRLQLGPVSLLSTLLIMAQESVWARLCIVDGRSTE